MSPPWPDSERVNGPSAARSSRYTVDIGRLGEMEAKTEQILRDNPELRDLFAPGMALDDDFSRSHGLPPAGGNNSSFSIDSGIATHGPPLERVKIGVDVQALPDLPDGKSLTLTVEESDDELTWMPQAEIPLTVVTGSGGTGSAAIAARYPLPKKLKALRLSAALDSGAGNLTQFTYTLRFVF